MDSGVIFANLETQKAIYIEGDKESLDSLKIEGWQRMVWDGNRLVPREEER